MEVTESVEDCRLRFGILKQKNKKTTTKPQKTRPAMLKSERRLR